MNYSNKVIKIDDPLHAAAQKAINAMHEFWKIRQETNPAAIQWIEDTEGRILIFTRGEYRDVIMDTIIENSQPTHLFEQFAVEEENDSNGSHGPICPCRLCFDAREEKRIQMVEKGGE